jgi:uncharacterized membrane protein YfcA
VLALLIGTTVGAQLGASYTRKAGGPWVRFCFGCLAFLGVVMVFIKLYIAMRG